VFLYHVGINGDLRNGPARPSGNGKRPPLPLDLHFLLTPWTKATRDAYRIIGAISLLFYDRAVLGFGDLLGDSIWAPDDTVEIMMEMVPVEQLFNIWDPTDIPYKLSLTYLARIIGIDSTVSAGGPPIAVARFPKAVS